MKNKPLIGIIAVLVVGFFVLVYVQKGHSQPRPGVAYADLGRTHGATGQELNTGDQPPTSGEHNAQEMPWQVYTGEIPDTRAIHNLEHGGIYVSYRPDLSSDQVAKLQALFFAPYSDANFKPSKVIMAPRSENKEPIVLSSWLRSETFNAFDANEMMQYYLRNVGISPEPTAK